MPRRADIRTILVVGSGPIVIGQACEFDYSGTQACKVLRSEGFEVVLVNPNPATIMTDPELADRTYIEPLTPASVLAICERERPDALLPTLGGQTALNVAVALAESGDLDRLGIALIGVSLEAIHRAEDRSGFKRAMLEAGLDVPRDFSLTGVIADRLAEDFHPPLTAADVPAGDMARLAVDLLMEQIGDASATPRHSMLAPPITLRSSTGARRRA